MFYCHLSQRGDYFKRYFSALTEDAEARENEALPDYVSMLLSGRTMELGEEEALTFINKNELRKSRVVGVYDMRGSDEEPNKSFQRTAFGGR
ncbi:hypothetical protein [Aerosticca soli]|jgi:hypothetical protein|uniref:hypothetical protein n=1 Tax=Aerosticca soli TaxID=2010829 RepID=UPI000F82DAD2|nr:hypothetical protein [Aerosticca soli]